MLRLAPEILNQEIASDGKSPSFHRILIGRKSFKYVTIDPGVYDLDDLCFPAILQKKLPLFPGGDWNIGRIQLQNGRPYFAETIRATLPTIDYLWQNPPQCYDYLSFEFGRNLKSHVQIVTSPHFSKPVIAKFARFYWEYGYIAEIEAYSWIHGRDIGPEFLGYLTEEGRIMGFLIKNVIGRRATIRDLDACRETVQRLHDLGVLHNDLNKNKFLISKGKAVLVDFECAERSEDEDAMWRELASLENMFSP